MRVALLINSKSQTSVPSLWVDSLNALDLNQGEIKLFSLWEGLINIGNFSDYDVIQCHHHKSAFIMYCLFAILRKKSKFIFVSQGSHHFLSTTNKAIQLIINWFFDHIVFVNYELFNQLNDRHKKILQNRHSIVFNAIEHLKPAKGNNNILKKYSINPSRKLVFNPARTVIEKNQIKLLESIKILSKKYKDILLVIAGDGNQMKNIISHIKKHQLEKNVMLLGSIPRTDVLHFYNQCDVYCMVSISEGLNTTFLEAMQLKTKMVVSNIDQFIYPLKKKGLNAEDLNIRFAEPNSSDDIAACIEQMLLKDGVSKLEKFPFLLEDMLAEYQDIYKRI